MRILLTILMGCLGGAAAAQPVAGGRDVLDRALIRLMPAPYTATIDPRVPADTVLTWTASGDWLRALHEATAAAGLRIQPQFETGRLFVLPGLTQPKPIAPSPAPAVATTSATDPKSGTRPVPSAAVAAATGVGAPTVTLPASSTTSKPSAFLLKPGQRIDAQFAEWSRQEGWSLIWTSEKSWVLPGIASVSYPGPVDVAIESAVKDLYANGVPVRLDIWEANKVMEISHAK